MITQIQDLMEAAAILWEEVISLGGDGRSEPWREGLRVAGSAEVRAYVCSLAPACLSEYLQSDALDFPFDFAPNWLRTNWGIEGENGRPAWLPASEGAAA
jgi:hypothetical protein